MKILWWGRFDPNYSRNGVIRELMRAKGYELVDFHPHFSTFGDLEARLKGVEKPDMVWVPCFRQRDMKAAARWARSKKVPLVFDPLISAYDKQVDEFKKVKTGSAGAARLLKWERGIFALADIVIADTILHAQYFEEKLGVAKSKLKVVYVGAESNFKPIEVTKKEDFEVLFYGSFLPLQGPDTIVEAAKMAKDLPIKWTFIGGGPLKEKCLKLAEGCENIRFEGKIPYSELPRRICEADILMGVFGTTDKAGRAMPNKFFQAIACGKPIVTRESAAYPEGALSSPAIKFIPPGDGAALFAAVKEWFENREALKAATDEARKVLEREFDARTISKQLDFLAFDAKKRKVSVIVPVYNVEKYLARCLDSVLAAAKAASEVETEIICVNDGSTDNSAAVLEGYADRVRVFHKENGGQGSARNLGLDNMSGDYVMFVDSDDYIPEDAIWKMVKVAKESALPLVISMRYMKNTLLPRENDVKWTVRKNSWLVDKKVEYSVWNRLYLSSLFENRRMPPILFEDYPTAVRICCDIEKFASIDEPMYVYCDIGDATTIRSPYSKRKLKDKLAGVRLIMEHSGAFAGDIPLRQAVKGVSTVIGKVAKAKDPMLVKLLLIEILRFSKDYPTLLKQLPLKAKFRLWKLKRSVK